jgi:hypothetical protein
MFNEAEEEDSAFCGCISVNGLKQCEIYVASNQAISRKELMKDSGCYQCKTD